MSTVYSSETFASEEQNNERSFLEEQEEDIARLAPSPQFRSPEVQFFSVHDQQDEMDKSGEIKGFSLNPLMNQGQVSDEESIAEEDLYGEIDHEPAENEMNKIIHYLAYMQDGEMKPAVVAEYPNIPIYNLQKHLLEQAWSAATGGPLAEILGELLDRNEKLRNRCRELEEVHAQLENDCSRLMTEDRQTLVKTLAEALGVVPVPGVTGLHELKREIIALRKAKASLETERLELTIKNATLANENAALLKEKLESMTKRITSEDEK